MQEVLQALKTFEFSNSWRRLFFGKEWLNTGQIIQTAAGMPRFPHNSVSRWRFHSVFGRWIKDDHFLAFMFQTYLPLWIMRVPQNCRRSTKEKTFVEEMSVFLTRFEEKGKISISIANHQNHFLPVLGKIWNSGERVHKYIFHFWVWLVFVCQN